MFIEGSLAAESQKPSPAGEACVSGEGGPRCGSEEIVLLEGSGQIKRCHRESDLSNLFDGGPADLFLWKSDHWTDFRALEPLKSDHWIVYRALEPINPEKSTGTTDGSAAKLPAKIHSPIDHLITRYFLGK